MAEGGIHQNTDTETTTTIVKEKSLPARSPNMVLKLKKPETDKKVQWDQKTVDNEFMNKKKSKCCCIYEKPKLFDESSSDEDDNDNDDCANCHGHKKKDFCALPRPSNSS
jgi:protein phosphatase 1 regulatory subunit 11